jgi:hypothetical protein
MEYVEEFKICDICSVPRNFKLKNNKNEIAINMIRETIYKFIFTFHYFLTIIIIKVFFSKTIS